MRCKISRYTNTSIPPSPLSLSQTQTLKLLNLKSVSLESLCRNLFECLESTFFIVLGSIKTGCPATPDYKSRFCSKHKQFTCQSYASSEPECISTTAQAQASNEAAPPGERVAEILMAKSTRTQTRYQVHM